MNGSAVWAGIGAQLRRPKGAMGWFVGHAMRLANAQANALAVQALAPQVGEDILELGCGPGHALRQILALDVGSVTAVDHSRLMIDQARLKNADAVAAGRLRLYCDDFETLPIDVASVDAVLAVNVAYFMFDEKAIAEACRVLKPCGRLVVYATSSSAMRNWRFVGPHSHRLFDGADLLALLKRGGFSDGQVTLQRVNAGFGVEGLIATGRRGGIPIG
ncbi:MAG: class I SAM-dependent methyltransferase [Hyphomicrobiales bacterium]